MDRPRSIGMAWYRNEDYPRILEVMADAGSLPRSHDAWLVSATQVEREVTRSGVRVVRVAIDPEAFVSWCRDNGVPANGAARARFANESHAASA